MYAFTNSKKNLRCIPSNLEKFKTVTYGALQFIDSLEFLNSSLKSLIENVAASGGIDSFPLLQLHYPNPQHQELLMRKNAYPYTWVSGPRKFNATELPTMAEFYNDLNKEAISQEEYDLAHLIWKEFSMKSFREYHILYLELDVILLADVLINFRKTVMNKYNLDPFHFISLPAFSWEAMLKFTKVKLEVLSDIDQYLFLEKGIKGGISVACQRYAQSNIPGTKTYDETKPNRTLAQFDLNSLYPDSMCRPLPVSDYSFIAEEEIQKLKIMEIADDSEYGYILSCAISIPPELHDMFNDFPLLPEKLDIKSEWLSKHSNDLKIKFQQKNSKIKKLVPNLFDKDSITLHYTHLKLCLRLGLKLEKIHKVLRFKQSPWLKAFMEFNMEARKNAANPFEASQIKIISNSIYGKMLSTARNRRDIRIINNKKKLEKTIRKTSFKSFEILDENLALVELQRINVLFNNPIICAFSVLEISKTILYSVYYENFMKVYGPERLRLCYVDTDSLLIRLEAENLFDEMSKHREWFDTSNFDPTHPLYSKENQGVYGLLKSETGSNLILEYVGLRAKMYSLICVDSKEKRVCKGIKKCVINKELRHKLYKECLFSNIIFRHGMEQIKSKKHKLYTMHLNKISLCSFDDKRYILADPEIKTYALGHYKISKGFIDSTAYHAPPSPPPTLNQAGSASPSI
jgi:hypothetical protein